MKRYLSIIAAMAVVFSLALSGCGQQKAESSGAAINEAKAMETTEQKVDYLIGQAKAFYNSKDFQGAVDIAQYVLRYLDKDNQAAKDLIEKARAQIEALAKSAAQEAGSRLGSFGR